MTIRNTRRIALAAAATPALAALLSAAPALAGDEGLYPEPTAPDASFLRVVTADTPATRIDGNAARVSAAGLTPYVEVAPGKVEISVDGSDDTVKVGANTHYSYVVDGDEAALVEDPVTESPAQADLVLYNLSDRDAFQLYAVEGDAVALKDVAPGKAAGVALKAPLTLTFELRAKGETLAALDPIDLRRGVATSIVVEGDGTTLTAAAEDSTYAE